MRVAALFLPVLLAIAASPAMSAPRPPPTWALGASTGEELRVSLITFGPGDDVATMFGHSALLVEDTATSENRVYNYGMFSFDSSLLVRYALGRLSFWVGETSLERTLVSYRSQRRAIRVQELLLPAERRLALARFLAWNVQPQNRGYLYHHFLDNCATRPRDAIDRVVGGRLSQSAGGGARMSLRDHVRRHTAISTPTALLLDFAMNDEVDRPVTVWDEAFLPAELEEQVAAAGLVANTRILGLAPQRPPIPREAPRAVAAMLAAGVFAGVVGLALALLARRSRGWRRVLGLEHLLVGAVIGMPGLVLASMWAFTDHTVAYANENVLLANPLTALALPLGFMLLVDAGPLRAARAVRALHVVWLALACTSVFAFGAKLLPLFGQDNAPFLALLVPLNIGHAVGAVLLARAAEPPSLG